MLFDEVSGMDFQPYLSLMLLFFFTNLRVLAYSMAIYGRHTNLILTNISLSYFCESDPFSISVHFVGKKITIIFPLETLLTRYSLLQI
jgi:hypothetical protein